MLYKMIFYGEAKHMMASHEKEQL